MNKDGPSLFEVTSIAQWPPLKSLLCVRKKNHCFPLSKILVIWGTESIYISQNMSRQWGSISVRTWDIWKVTSRSITAVLLNFSFKSIFHWFIFLCCYRMQGYSRSNKFNRGGAQAQEYLCYLPERMLPRVICLMTPTALVGNTQLRWQHRPQLVSMKQMYYHVLVFNRAKKGEESCSQQMLWWLPAPGNGLCWPCLNHKHASSPGALIPNRYLYMLNMKMVSPSQSYILALCSWST